MVHIQVTVTTGQQTRLTLSLDITYVKGFEHLSNASKYGKLKSWFSFLGVIAREFKSSA